MAHLSSVRPCLAALPSTVSSSSSSSFSLACSLNSLSLGPKTNSAATRRRSRTFTTTSTLQTKTIKPHLLPSRLIPPYPYGERQVYKQSNRGLYGTARIQFGNNVSKKHGIKTQRFWRPNVHVKTFVVPELGGARVKTRLTLRVLRSIRREGGLAEYLLKSKAARIKDLGPSGWNLRWLVMQSTAVQQRFNEERVALGLEPKEIVDRDDVIQYALDVATPGALSKKSQATLAELRAADMAADAFVLGDSRLGDVEGVQELSDEEEEVLLRELDNEAEVKVKTERQGVEL